MVRLIKSKGLAVWFVTNGTLISEKNADALVEAGIDKIRISVDTADEALYGKIKKGAHLSATLENISLLRDVKRRKGFQCPYLSANVVVFKENKDGLTELITVLGRHGISEVTLLPLVSFNRGLATEQMQIDFYTQGFGELFETLKAHAQREGIELNRGVSMESKGERFCQSGLYIDCAGTVFPCCNITSVRLGSVHTDTAPAIGRRWMRFTRWVKKKNLYCHECNAAVDKR
jgi:MoaA/NifB/PqqE/SkfB family radical SAM enzyme